MRNAGMKLGKCQFCGINSGSQIQIVRGTVTVTVIACQKCYHEGKVK